MRRRPSSSGRNATQRSWPERLTIPSVVADQPIPPEIATRLTADRQRIEAFQDRWDIRPIEQFVAADYELVFQSLRFVRETHALIGNRFLEWGCGFAVVTALASSLGFDAIGIEAEASLFQQATQTIELWSCDAEVVEGNFLPSSAKQLADDSTLPSLGHAAPTVYNKLGLDIDDFALIYAYPWPGEDDFMEAVFDRYAARGAMLLMFCGPNDMRLLRK